MVACDIEGVSLSYRGEFLASSKRIAANRRNATKSTGPRTHSGKAIASQNSLKHGLLSKQLVLPDEDESELLALRTTFTETLAPEGALECLLVDEIVVNAWRLARVHRVEAAILALGHYSEIERRELSKAGRFERHPLDHLLHDPPVITDHEAHEAAVLKSDTARDLSRDRAGSALGTAVACDLVENDTLNKFSRYQATVERSLYRAIHELQRIQGQRGIASPSSAAVDLEVSLHK